MEKLRSNDIGNVTLVIEGYQKSAKVMAKRHKVMKTIGLVLTYAALVFLTVVALFPFYWMIITSLKSEHEFNATDVTYFPIEGIAFENYVAVFKNFNFLKYFGNTLVVILISTGITLVLTIFAAFAFSKLKFRGRDTLFFVFLSAMMIPTELLVTTNYLTMYKYGLLQGGRFATYLAIMLPFLVNIFYIYLLRQNFMQIPNELYLASKVDGKSDWQFLWKVMVPIASPTIVTLLILKVISTWNAYAWPSMVIRNEDYAIVTVGLKDFADFSVDGDPERQMETLKMAGVSLVTIPLILLFICFRKYIMRGVSKAGIKG